MIDLLLKDVSTRPVLKKRSQNRTRKQIVAGLATLSVATALSAPFLTSRKKRTHLKVQRKTSRKPRTFLTPFWADALVGAIGEIGQLAILYPLDTIKVRCQAHGASSHVVWSNVRSQGFTLSNIRSLFAGCAPSAVCAALIGACYLASFSMAKRVLDRPRISRLAIQAQSIQRTTDSLNEEALNSGTSTSGREISEEIPKGRHAESSNAQGSAINDTKAALLASLMTSVLEAPVELFRHRMQAGIIKGTMLSNMSRAFSTEGMTSFYWGFLPFIIKGIPYDVAELFSYSQLSKYQLKIPTFSSLPLSIRDSAIGALAGAAAVLCSMPADCIKTRMELGLVRPPTGLIKGSAAFLKTGRLIITQQGLKGLFVGLKPRLLENVPSTMFYWVLVAALRRSLEPYIERKDVVWIES